MVPVASSMAQKEARHREVVDELHEQIDHIQQERDELTSHVRYLYFFVISSSG